MASQVPAWPPERSGCSLTTASAARATDGSTPSGMPSPLTFKGHRLPASYANFFIGNKLVLVPTFNDPKDRIALGILAELFPGRTVVGLSAVDLVWGLGSVHCLTHEEPE